MPNVQSIIAPVAGLMPLPNASSIALSEVTVSSETLSESDLAVDIANSEAEFSRLLVNPEQEKSQKPRLLFKANAEPESPAVLGGEAYELTEFSGKQFPFWGNSLPTEPQVGKPLQHNVLLAGQDLSAYNGLSGSDLELQGGGIVAGATFNKESAQLFPISGQTGDSQIDDSSSLVLPKAAEAPTAIPISSSLATNFTGEASEANTISSSLETGSTDEAPAVIHIFPNLATGFDTVAAAATPISSILETGFIGGGEVLASQLPLGDGLSAAQQVLSGLNTFSVTTADQASVGTKPADAFSDSGEQGGSIAASKAAFAQGSDLLISVTTSVSSELESASLRSASGIQSSASFELFSKFMIDHTSQSRAMRSELWVAQDGIEGFQSLPLEGGDFESLLSTSALKVGDKALIQGFAGGGGSQPVEHQLGQSVGGASTQLASALNQWRAEQDGSGLVSSDLGERQGLAKMGVTFGQAAWGENLGSQLSLLLAKNMDSAQIQLDPPELGPLGVRIQINQDQVTLQFTSGHAVVREALEQSSQRLQQMLSEEGLDLVDVDVSDEKQPGQEASDQNQDSDSTSFDERVSREGSRDEGDSLLTHSHKVTVDDGKIDYFI